MKPERKIITRFSLSMIAYVILVPVSLVLLQGVAESSSQIVFALLPIIPIPFMILSTIQYIRNLDEFQQRIQLEAFAFSFGITGLVTFTLGLLENAGAPQLSMIWVFPMMIILWWLGQILAGRRYQ